MTTLVFVILRPMQWILACKSARTSKSLLQKCLEKILFEEIIFIHACNK
ncbi:hypothetical protein GYH30_044204 [Glycine max]|uniref:Uncharacterized protein n=1 Tax=Glycine max TaxID=3847 RepID=A0A0R0FWU4_SOYBN|nr:hypothetical protein GYH30_044204 [Glycine max]